MPGVELRRALRRHIAIDEGARQQWQGGGGNTLPEARLGHAADLGELGNHALGFIARAPQRAPHANPVDLALEVGDVARAGRLPQLPHRQERRGDEPAHRQWGNHEQCQLAQGSPLMFFPHKSPVCRKLGPADVVQVSPTAPLQECYLRVPRPACNQQSGNRHATKRTASPPGPLTIARLWLWRNGNRHVCLL